MTVIVTVNVEARYRGFLASAMLEIAPGVYTSPNMTGGRHPGADLGRVERMVFPAWARLNRDDVARLRRGKRTRGKDPGRISERDSRRRRGVLG